MEELRAILLDLQLKLKSIVDRIPEGTATDNASTSSGRALSMARSPAEAWSTENEVPGEGINGCPEQYHSPVHSSFHKWARIILLLYIDKVGRVETWTQRCLLLLTCPLRHSASLTNLSSRMPAVVFGLLHDKGE